MKVVGAGTPISSILRSNSLAIQDPEYIKALESALPQNLKISLHGSRSDWPSTVKWIKLLVALSQRCALLSLPVKIL